MLQPNQGHSLILPSRGILLGGRTKREERTWLFWLGYDTVANGPAGNFSSINTGGFAAPTKTDFLQFLDGTGEERNLFVVLAPGHITVMALHPGGRVVKVLDFGTS
jgi:hypothetical protein